MKKILVCLGLFLFCNCAFGYDFEVSGKKISFNEDELKFYENNTLMTVDEVKALFSGYETVLVSHFDKNRKYKMKNSIFKSRKILLLNDTNRTFHGFYIYPFSSRVHVDSDDKNGAVKSLITLYGKKNVRLKHSGGDEFEIVAR